MMMIIIRYIIIITAILLVFNMGENLRANWKDCIVFVMILRLNLDRFEDTVGSLVPKNDLTSQPIINQLWQWHWAAAVDFVFRLVCSSLKYYIG